MKLLNTRLAGVLAAAVLVAAAVVGCSNSSPVVHGEIPLEEGKRTVLIEGLSPDWDLEEMVRRSDAIAIGVLREDLGSKTEPGPFGDPPKYHYVFTDYKLDVEQAFYPGTLPENIVVLAETGVKPGSDDYIAVGFEGVPSYAVGDRVILFMENMSDDAKFGDGASRPVPDGFTGDDYYLAIVGGTYGKIQRSGDKWEDSRTGESFTTQELASAIQEIKKNSDND